MKITKIYTDGACSGNPGPGGWAVVINLDKECKQYFGGEINTTNNRMELTAVIRCFERIIESKSTDTKFEIYSDSAYVVNAINNGWLKSWEHNNWCTKQKEPIKNKDLWEQAFDCLHKLSRNNQKVVLVKIKGHAGNSFNELCDKLAKQAAMKIKR